MRAAPLLLPVLASGCFAAGALPPSRAEIGSTVVSGSGESSPGLRVGAGVHTASGTTDEEIGIDVGIGYVYERTEAAVPEAVARSEATTPPAAEMTGAHDQSHGVYAEVARTLHRSPHRRLWIGGRGELLADQGGVSAKHSAGLAVRAGYEIFAAGEGAGSYSDRCGGGVGVAHGAWGAGMFVESGYRAYGDGRGALIATAGIAMRLPFLAGVAIDTCK